MATRKGICDVCKREGQVIVRSYVKRGQTSPIVRFKLCNRCDTGETIYVINHNKVDESMRVIEEMLTDMDQAANGNN